MQYNHQNRDGIMSANFQGFPFCALALALFTFTVAHGQQVLIAPPAVPEELRAPDSTVPRPEVVQRAARRREPRLDAGARQGGTANDSTDSL